MIVPFLFKVYWNDCIMLEKCPTADLHKPVSSLLSVRTNVHYPLTFVIKK